MAGVRTAKQKAALRKAQLASARKRRGSGKNRKSATSPYSKKRRLAAVSAAAGFYLANQMIGYKTGRQIKPFLAAGIGFGIGRKVLRGGKKKRRR